jgi:uncharacterized membrane protein YbhN (UPF0104 family)
MLGLAGVIFYKVLGRYDPAEAVRRVGEIPGHRLVLAVVCMLMSYLSQSTYDYLALRSVREGAVLAHGILGGCVSNGLTNNMGFSLLTGTSVRYRFYSAWGYAPLQIAQVVALAKLSFFNGLLFFTGIMQILAPVKLPAPWHLPPPRIVGVLLCLPFLALLAWNALGRGNVIQVGKFRLLRPSQWILIGQMAMSSLHLVFSGLTLFLLLPGDAFPGGDGFKAAFAFVSAFMAIKIVVLLFPIPGSLGVFEGTAVALLTPAIPAYPLLGALLAYRLIYYLLPFALALLLLAGFEFVAKAGVASRFLRRPAKSLVP